MKYRPDRPLGVALYALGQFLPVLLGFAAFLEQPGWQQPLPTVLAAAFVAVSLVAITGVLAVRPWAWPVDSARLALAATAALLAPALPIAAQGALIADAAGALVWLYRCRPAGQLA